MEPKSTLEQQYSCNLSFLRPQHAPHPTSCYYSYILLLQVFLFFSSTFSNVFGLRSRTRKSSPSSSYPLYGPFFGYSRRGLPYPNKQQQQHLPFLASQSVNQCFKNNRSKIIVHWLLLFFYIMRRFCNNNSSSPSSHLNCINFLRFDQPPYLY